MSGGKKIFLSYAAVTLIFVALLVVGGLFSTGFLSDDYVAAFSANLSSLKDKFTSNIIYHNTLLFRPLWSLSLSFDILIQKLIQCSAGCFIVPILHNLILYITFALISSYTLFYLIRDKSISLLFYSLLLVFPNNLHSLLWMVCRHDTQAGILGMLAVLFMLLFNDNQLKLYKYLSAAAFLFSLMFKESGVVFPFIIILMVFFFGRENHKFKLRNYIPHLLILLLYVILKLSFLGSSAGNVLGYFSFSLSDRLSVFPKALFSLFSFTDYMSVIYYLSTKDITNISISVIPVAGFAGLIMLAFVNKYKRLLLLLGIFFVSISPYFISGYFRPQLVIIPFAVTFLFVFYEAGSLKGKSILYVKFLAAAIIFVSLLGTYSLLNDYKNAYKILRNNNEIISGEVKEQDPVNIFLFLPSRLKQVYLLDNVPFVYNYFKYNDFEIKDSVLGFINYAALDIESLNSEIKLEKLNDTAFTAVCTGKTQFFYNPHNNSVMDYENEFIKCQFLKGNMFLNKCKDIKVILKKPNEYKYVALTNKETLNLNRK